MLLLPTSGLHRGEVDPQQSHQPDFQNTDWKNSSSIATILLDQGVILSTHSTSLNDPSLNPPVQAHSPSSSVLVWRKLVNKSTSVSFSWQRQVMFSGWQAHPTKTWWRRRRPATPTCTSPKMIILLYHGSMSANVQSFQTITPPKNPMYQCWRFSRLCGNYSRRLNQRQYWAQILRFQTVSWWDFCDFQNFEYI